MGFTRARVSRSAAATPAYSPQQRSLFASRPFAPVEQEADSEALGTDAAVPLQAKLAIGQPGDRYEQEADRVASTVVNQIGSPQSPSVQREAMPEEEEDLQMKPLAGSNASLVQREAMPEEEEDLQMKPLAGSNTSLVQREEIPEEEKDLQMKPLQRVAEAGGAEASPDLETSITQARGSGQLLDQSIREPIEQAMGADFSGVKVHTDAQADQLNRSVQARAFTTGQDVFFRQGEYSPDSRGGQELIAHELTHVVQQTGEAVSRKPLTQPQSSQYPAFKASSTPSLIQAMESSGGEESSGIVEAGSDPILVEKRGTGFEIKGLINCVGVVIKVSGPPPGMKLIAAAGGHFVTPEMYNEENETFTEKGSAFISEINNLIKNFSKDSLDAEFHVKATAVEGSVSMARKEAGKAAEAIREKLNIGGGIYESSDNVKVVI